MRRLSRIFLLFISFIFSVPIVYFSVKLIILLLVYRTIHLMMHIAQYKLFLKQPMNPKSQLILFHLSKHSEMLRKFVNIWKKIRQKHQNPLMMVMFQIQIIQPIVQIGIITMKIQVIVTDLLKILVNILPQYQVNRSRQKGQTSLLRK